MIAQITYFRVMYFSVTKSVSLSLHLHTVNADTTPSLPSAHAALPTAIHDSDLVAIVGVAQAAGGICTARVRTA